MMISDNHQKKMPRSGGRSSASRKPLLEITNGGVRLAPVEMKTSSAVVCDGGGGDLDLLLLAHSDLSNLVVQADELVALALEQTKIRPSGSLAIKSLTFALRDMHSSLQAWIPRLRQAFSENSGIEEKKPEKSMDSSHLEINEKLEQAIDSSHVPSETRVPKTTMLDDNDNDNEHSLVVSPSPLVSWRGDNCMVDCGRQLFLLTPLPNPRSRLPWRHTHSRDKKSPAEVQFEFPRFHALDVENKSKTQLCSPLVFSNIENFKSRSVLLLTSGAQVSDDPASEVAAETLASRYQELFGFQTTDGIASHWEDHPVESLDWFLSPPKTCVLMEPNYNKPNISTPNAVCLSTPMVKAFVTSTVKRGGKQPGETTLKRELWTKFNAVSTTEPMLNTIVFEKTGQKAFLEMLEEASSESTSLEI